MKKERFLELTKIAIDVMNLLDEKGVTRSERCAVNSICNSISNHDYSEDGRPLGGACQPVNPC